MSSFVRSDRKRLIEHQSGQRAPWTVSLLQLGWKYFTSSINVKNQRHIWLLLPGRTEPSEEQSDGQYRILSILFVLIKQNLAIFSLTHVGNWAVYSRDICFGIIGVSSRAGSAAERTYEWHDLPETRFFSYKTEIRTHLHHTQCLTEL